MQLKSTKIGKMLFGMTHSPLPDVTHRVSRMNFPASGDGDIDQMTVIFKKKYHSQ